MRIEKWKLGDKEVEVPILDDDEIEDNSLFDNSEELEKTQEIKIESEQETKDEL